MVLGYGVVGSVLVIGTAGNERSDRLLDPVEQGAEFGGIVDLLTSQGRCHDHAGFGSNAQMQLAPSLAALATMFLDQPFAWPAQLHARAVDQQVQRSACRPGLGCHRQGPGPPAQGGVIRHRQIQPLQPEQRADQSCRSGWWKTVLKVSAVSIARFE